MKQIARMSAFLLLTTTLTAGTEGTIEIARPAIASIGADGKLSLKAEPNQDRSVAPPAVIFNRLRESSDGAEPESILEVKAGAGITGELEATAYYDENVVWLMPRRDITPNATEPIRWQLPLADRLSSYTLTLRSANPAAKLQLESVAIITAENLSMRERLHAFLPHPLRVMDWEKPINNSSLQLELIAPADMTLSQSAFTLVFQSTEHPVSLNFKRHERWQNALRAEILIPAREIAKGGEQVVLLDESRKPLAEVTVYPGLGQKSSLTIPNRSIEDFAVMERNGELIVYPLVADEFQLPGASGAALPAEMAWLAATSDGEAWVVKEALLRTRRDVNWLAGGPASAGAGVSDGITFFPFTTVAIGGGEAFSIASAMQSTRVTPIAANPVYTPAPLEDGSPSIWRGNVFFDYLGTRLVVSLTQTAEGLPEPRVLACATLPMWLDLGPMALPDLDGAATRLAGFEYANKFFLLVGPVNQLYSSSHPLRDWELSSIEVPDNWERPKLLSWKDRPWIFGIVRHHGRGMVTWKPLEVDGAGFRLAE